MLKLIFDTNILISSLIQKNYPFLIVDYVLKNRQVQLCISEDLLKEYHEVLTRIKFFRYPDYEFRSRILLRDIKKIASLYLPTLKLDIIKDDADNRLLELADACKADFLITGNSKHFNFPTYKNTRIISPKEFWEIIQNKTDD